MRMELFRAILVGWLSIGSLAIAQGVWPNQTGFTFLGSGGCHDDLWRPMSSVQAYLGITNETEIALRCFDICERLRANMSKCMGVQVESTGSCTVLDRDWADADQEAVDSHLGQASTKDFAKDFPGTHVSQSDSESTDSETSQSTVCYRRGPVDCSVAPNCTALQRYPCEWGKAENTCDLCLPRYHTQGEKAAGNSTCIRDSLPAPTLRIAVSGSTEINPHEQTALLGFLHAMKYAWESSWPELPIPLEERQNFSLEFVAFSENWTKVAPADELWGGTGMVVMGDIMPGIAAMAGTTGTTLQEQWELRQTDPPGQPVHAVLGTRWFLEDEEKLASIAEVYRTPVLGYMFDDPILTRLPYYIRSNPVALDPGLAIGALFRHLDYTRIFIFQQVREKRIHLLIAEINPEASLEFHGPQKQECIGPINGDSKECMKDVLKAWARMRAEDARVIAHENSGEMSSGEMVEYLLALGTDLLGEKTLYAKSQGSCGFVQFLDQIAIEQSVYHRLLETFYESPDHKETAERCAACYNIAALSLRDEQRRNRTFAVTWLFSPENPQAALHSAFCPHLPNATALLECDSCDTTLNVFVNAECIRLEERFFAAFDRAVCVKAMSTENEPYQFLFWDYAMLVRAGVPGPNMTEDGLNASARLRQVGMPGTYLDAYEPGGIMWELGLANAVVAQPISWVHAFIPQYTDNLLGRLAPFSHVVWRIMSIVDAFLTVLVAYNSFVKVGGDADLQSAVWRKHYPSNPVAAAFRRFILSARFEGLRGRVEYQKNGERNVLYKLGQLRASAPDGCFIAFRSASRSAPLEDVLPAVSVSAEWNFLWHVAERNTSSAELLFDVNNDLGCGAYADGTNLTGRIAIVFRGGCFFSQKAQNAQTAGFAALIVANTLERNPVTMSGSDAVLKMPAFMVESAAIDPVLVMLRNRSLVVATLPPSRCTDPRYAGTHSTFWHEDMLLFDPKARSLTTFSKTLAFNGGSAAPPPQAPPLCGAGSWYSSSSRECIICQPGKYLPGDAAKCLTCPAGSFSNTTRSSACNLCQSGAYAQQGALECLSCPIGTVSLAVGASECAPCRKGQIWSAGTCSSCSAGSFQSREAATACESCQSGTFSADVDSSACEECPFGTFQASNASTTCMQCDITSYQPRKGASKCLACHEVIPNSMAPGTGTMIDDHCQCAPGKFLRRPSPDDTGSCVDCLPGLICHGGLDSEGTCCEPPKQDARIHAGRPAFRGGPIPFHVRCADSRRCPAGRELAECPPHAGGLACDICDDAYVYSDGDGKCVSCDDQLVWPIVLFLIILCLAFPMGIGWYAGLTTTVQSETKMTIIATFTLSINVLQVLTAFRELSLDWPEPMRSIYSALSIFAFRLDFLKIGCVASNSPIMSYFVMLLVHPLFATMLLVAFAALKWGPRQIRRSVTASQVANAQGLCVLVLYVAISLVALLPWQCERNLDGSQSVVSFRSVTCWERGHEALLMLSAVSIMVYDLGFITFVTWVTCRYQANIMRPGGVEFLRFYRFLFNRFKSRHYYFALIYCLRNLLIALAPVLFVNNVFIQVIVISTVISGWSLAQSWFQPWRTSAANCLDAVASMGLLMVLLCGMMVADVDKSQGLDTVQVCFHIVVWGVLLSFSGVLLQNLAYILSPPKPFGTFLSHHKLGAAVLARWFKLLISGWTDDKVYLDADNLSELGTLLETCAFKTKSVMVILTRETLRRIWCAGEVTSALRHGVRTVLVCCGDYSPPTDEFIRGLDTEWAELDKAQLATQGVEVSHIKEAYVILRTMPTIGLIRADPMEQQRDIVRTALRACQGLQTGSRTMLFKRRLSMADMRSTLSSAMTTAVVTAAAGKPRNSSAAQSLAVLGNCKTPEDNTLAAVLAILLQKELGVQVRALECPDPAELSNLLDGFFYLLVVLTRGVLEQSQVAAAVALGRTKGLEMLSVNADTAFEFPSTSWFSELTLGNIISVNEADRYDVLLGDVAEAYQLLFTNLSLRFSPHASEFIQGAEIQEMAPRFKNFDVTMYANVSRGSSTIQAALSSQRSGVQMPAGTQPDAATAADDWDNDDNAVLKI